VLESSEANLNQLAEKIVAAIMEKLLERLRRSDLPMSREYLSPREVSELFGIPVRSLEAMRGVRKGPPYYKLGKCVKYRLRDVQDFIEAGGPVK
jgi:hypothetical protein